MNYYFLTSVIYLTAGVLIFIFGLVIFRENPKQRINQVAGLMMVFAALGPIMSAFGLVMSSTPHELTIDASFFRRIFILWEFFFPFLLLFALIYPYENPITQRHPKIVYWIFIPHIFHFLILLFFQNPDQILSIASFESLNERLGLFFQPISLLTSFLVNLVGIFYEFHLNFFALINLLYILSALAFMYSGHKKVTNPQLRKQVGFVLWGIRASVGVYAVAFLLPRISPLNIAESIGHGITVIALLLGVGSIAWAIIKYQFLDIRLFIRRGIVFSLATGLIVGLYLMLYGQTEKIATALFGYDLPIIEVMFLILAVFFFQPILSWVERMIEHFFPPQIGDFSVALKSLSHDIMTVLDMEKLTVKIIATLQEQLAISPVYLMIQEANGNFQTRGLDNAKGTRIDVQKESAIIRIMHKQERPITLDQIQQRLTDEADVNILSQLNSQLLVPLKYRDNLNGVLCIGCKEMSCSFSADEIMLLEVLSGQIAIALENSKLYAESLAKRRMEEEIQLAREIQQLLLPSDLPTNELFELATLNIPCKEVGGDYYDIFDIGSGRYGIAIGDISGKGIPASLLMSNLQAAFRASAMHYDTPQQVLYHLNQHVARTTSAEKYATFIFGIFDPRSYSFSFSNAGHNFPIWRRSVGECKLLHYSDLIVGLDETSVYRSFTIKLDHGDLLVFYTDGITEAMNPDFEEFGENRLLEVVNANCYSSAELIRNLIYEAMAQFTLGAEQYDDITLIVLKIK